MIVQGRVKVYWSEESLGNLVVGMKVKFKLPNQKINRSRKTIIASTWSQSREEFWEAAITRLSSKEIMEEVAKKVIIDYIKTKYKETDTNKKYRKVQELIKSVNENFIVEVEYEPNKNK